MDFRSLLDRYQPTELEKDAVDALLGEPTSVWVGGEASARDGRVAYGGHAARSLRHMLLPALHAVQDATGAVSRGALGYISERLTVPPAEAYGVATFYALFDTDGPGGETVHVCDDIVCGPRGGDALVERLSSDGVAVVRSPCLGRCERPPAVLRHRPGAGYREETGADGGTQSAVPQEEGLRVLAGVAGAERGRGDNDREDLGKYRARGGYRTLARAIELGSEEVISRLEESKLRGRGGASFPIGIKWRSLAEAAGDIKYVVANGDESEPGTYKDRILMEKDPFAVVEAMTLYGLVTGAGMGFIYVRGEYPEAESSLRSAVSAAYADGLLGGDAASSGQTFDLEIRRGAGAYICGEETALFASIEGFRGEPRQKPPFPTDRGLFHRPTGINNIETLLAALLVISEDRGFSELGTPESTGSKLFSVSGDVSAPGVYEVEMGLALSELLAMAGSTEDVGAVLLGGAAGSFVGPEGLDVPLTFEDTRAANLTLGSGSVVVFESGTDFGPVLARIARFFRDESCGQCVPCRIGTVRQEEALARIGAGKPMGTVDDEMLRLKDVALVMTDASICGLGQTASSAIQSAIGLGLMETP